MRRYKNILLLILIVPLVVFAQQSTRYYNKENGLPSNVIYHSIQDSKGFLWFSTDKGVSRFDGYSFVNYSIDDGLTDTEVFKMYEDSQHRIWFLTYNGKLCYYLNGKIHNPSNTPYLGSVKNEAFFSKVIEDNNGSLFFMRENFNELYQLNDTIFTPIKIQGNHSFVSLYKNKEHIYIICLNVKTDYIRGFNLYRLEKEPVLVDSITSENVYVQFFGFGDYVGFINKGKTGKEDMVIHYGLNLNDTKRFVPDKTLYGKNAVVYSTVERNHLLYVNTSCGVFVFDKNFKLKQHYLPNQATTSTTIDFEGGIWLTNKNGGVHYFSYSGSSPITNIQSYINTIIPDPYQPNRLWFTGVGEYYAFDKTTQKYIHYTVPTEMGLHELTTDIAFLDDKNILIGNGTGILLQSNNVRKIAPDKAGIKKILIDNDTIYYARSNNTIKQHRSKLFIPSTISQEAFLHVYPKRTLCVLKDNLNRLWLGSNEGVAYYQNGKIIEPFKNITTRINKVVMSSSNMIVFCSDINGMYTYQQDSLIHLSKENGLLSDQINSAHFDKNNNLWVASVKGISKIIFTPTLHIENYSSANGLIDDFINDLYELNDSTLLLGTPSGLYSYVYTQHTTKVQPRINLTGVEVNSEKILVEHLAHLNYNENNIKLDFTGISYNSNKNIEYWYSLDKHSNNWQKINTRALTFINLSPGKYTLSIKCKNVQDIWSDPIYIPINIKPPLYKTPLFIISVILLTICSIIVFFILYRNKINKENKIKLLINETRQKALRAQLNPHFIFNALNSIQYLFLSGKEIEGQEYLSKFSVILRNTLNNSDKTYVTLQEELDNLKLYMELEQIRKKEKFTFKFNTDEGVNTHSLLIPSMLLQPIVENAIWHGLESLKTHGEISVSVNIHNDDLIRIVVADNGIGINASRENKKDKKHISKGTNLIYDRINALNMQHNDIASLEIIDTGKGTNVEIRLPKMFN